jgi:hypothetical protein
VIQTLFSKNNGAGLSRLPLTREDLYVRR